ncbi:hypothetical protein HD554DRAFT_1257979 [Boletus coccyginus]|nr:hypothetical protein HD554DRAFT_1257979 [Boletus coccyginus]
MRSLSAVSLLNSPVLFSLFVLIGMTTTTTVSTCARRCRTILSVSTPRGGFQLCETSSPFLRATIWRPAHTHSGTDPIRSTFHWVQSRSGALSRFVIPPEASRSPCALGAILAFERSPFSRVVPRDSTPNLALGDQNLSHPRRVRDYSEYCVRSHSQHFRNSLLPDVTHITEEIKKEICTCILLDTEDEPVSVSGQKNDV